MEKREYEEQNEPDFLRKLKQQYAGQDTPRQNRPSTISKRLQVDAEDDDPTYVDAETNEVVTQDDYQTMTGRASEQVGDESQKATEEHDEQAGKLDTDRVKADESIVSQKENVAEVGERKKRRAGKMIGKDEDVSQNEVKPDVDQSIKHGPQKKRKKKIKLSFADDANHEGE
ncbi:MAG: hypothetical protein M1816_007100 [Peltula sp. TS41687]|nr:MAG: hypothetical protein M1816_007100 [Peltula sp. TS41687]